MKAYLLTTGLAFGAIVVAHMWRTVVEGPQLWADPVWVILTLLAAGLCAWAFSLLRGLPRDSGGPRR
jgi:tetrahydromethanopterin S-methyltransferase subunit E